MALGVASARAFGGVCLLVVGFVLGASFPGAFRRLDPIENAPSIGRQCRVEDALTGGHRCAEVLRRSFRVGRVIDGDTLVLSGYDGEATKVRLLGIDAPERGEAGYEEAGQALRELIAESGGVVEIEFPRPGAGGARGKRDNFGRLLCRVIVRPPAPGAPGGGGGGGGDPVDAGERLLQLGLAERYPRERE
jgi:endonuclease YncB( thermonuclease family)